MKNLETKINHEIEKFQENNNAKIGDKFKMRSGKRIETIEIIDIVVNLNSKLEIVHINFIAKMQATSAINEMIFDLCNSTLRLRCEKI